MCGCVCVSMPEFSPQHETENLTEASLHPCLLTHTDCRQSRRLTLQPSPGLAGVTPGDVSDCALSELQHLRASLTHLELCACAMIEAGPALSQLAGLQCLSLRGCNRLRPEGLTVLQQLPSLSALDLSGLEQWGDEHVWILTGLKQLKVGHTCSGAGVQSALSALLTWTVHDCCALNHIDRFKERQELREPSHLHSNHRRCARLDTCPSTS